MKKLNYIRVTHGTEGPTHDPYAVETIRFTDMKGYTTTLKMGSLSGDNLFAENDPFNPFATGEDAFSVWETMTGLTVARAMKIWYEHLCLLPDPMGCPRDYI